MSVQIRLATKQDITGVQDLSLALFKDPTSASDAFSDHAWAKDERGYRMFAQAIENKDEALWVADDAGRLVGYLAAGPAAFQDWRPIKRAELYSFYVAPEYRSQGVGARLCEQFFAWARDQKAVTAVVEAYADNNRAVAFYQKMGFRPESLVLEAEL